MLACHDNHLLHLPAPARSAYAGSYVAIDEALGAAVGRTARWRAAVAGLLSGPALLLTGSAAPHTSLALYIFVRAGVLAVRCGLQPHAAAALRTALAPFRWGPLAAPLTSG